MRIQTVFIKQLYFLLLSVLPQTYSRQAVLSLPWVKVPCWGHKKSSIILINKRNLSSVIKNVQSQTIIKTRSLTECLLPSNFHSPPNPAKVEMRDGRSTTGTKGTHSPVPLLSCFMLSVPGRCLQLILSPVGALMGSLEDPLFATITWEMHPFPPTITTPLVSWFPGGLTHI